MSDVGKELYEKVICEDEKKEYQLRLTVNEFRGVEYIHIRKYYLDFVGDWCASNQGVHFNMDIDSTKELFRGLAEIISLAESRELIEEYFGDVIKDIYLN